MSRQHSAGKGDRYRPVDQRKWAENWDNIFKKKTKKLTRTKTTKKEMK